ncbi:CPXCG motif-containing cysteine-rich protein [Tamlana sp. 2_MG-2023]|uniref:CPXCG motif-containing cysteine-rich protein n=1 Tax=unclassified Tamlana TaxID=2614803 RepID=UPI0026E43E9E|nr:MULTISPECIES: CPXCG motif-containing cysteine-rich protein [unclassified Tamlana]MDO6761401.1 CPXCG motif-containing cysteine-rich protein [Tamlana sp. 2_MG-2023]MDO6791985.1 CPXCG motif-containing cysteine-rich protein [Tamlana sp. 1_MG-2023]
MIEHPFTCPYCWETISVLVDTSIKSQIYIEDCEVCCNPFQISLKINNTELIHFQAVSIEQ